MTLPEPLGLGMIPVPAGPFLMGTGADEIEAIAAWDDEARRWADKGRFDRERPRSMVRLPDFWIGRYPVTVGAFRPFIEAGGYGAERFWAPAGWRWLATVGRTEPDHWRDGRWAGEDDLPVVGLSRYEAHAFTRWLSEQEAHPFRLPTEAEWEKAARGVDGRLFPWGEGFGAGRANTREAGLERTTRVDAYSATDVSPYGCIDMGGNASEWTASAYRPYPYQVDADCYDPAGELLRVIRGGSWFKGKLRARTAARGYNDPDFADNDLGFRLACSQPRSESPSDGRAKGAR
jgi:formylglycine-generating enzyme required for sulfatase activity